MKTHINKTLSPFRKLIIVLSGWGLVAAMPYIRPLIRSLS